MRLAMLKVSTFVPNDVLVAENHKVCDNRGRQSAEGWHAILEPARENRGALLSRFIAALTGDQCLKADGSRRLVHRLGHTWALSALSVDSQSSWYCLFWV